MNITSNTTAAPAIAETDSPPTVETDSQPAGDWVGIVAPPSQIDVMHCGDYVPEPGPTLRAGSLDFKRIASHGFQC